MASSTNFNGDGDGEQKRVKESEVFGEPSIDGINQSYPGGAMDSVGGDEGGMREADPNEGHLLLKIPEDIWPQILQNCTQYEVVRSRSVCKKWLGIVDKVIDFNVTVNERKGHLERLSQLRIRNCQISRLDSPDQFVLQEPGLLRSLEMSWMCTINPAAFKLIVDGATKLEHLDINVGGFVVGARVPEELSGTLNGLSNLRRLEIGDFNPRTEDDAIKAGILSRILAHQMPLLKTFDFHRWVRQASSPHIQHELVQFLNCTPALQQVSLCLREDETPIGSPEALPDWENVISLPELHTLELFCETQFLPICARLVNAATHLKTLRMYGVGENFVLPSQILSGPLFQNAASLVEVDLRGFCLSTSMEIQPGRAPTPLDAGVFRNASNLKKLVLSREEQDWKLYPNELPEQPNIINLWMLPSSLEVLDIERFSIRTDELEEVLRGLRTMKDLRLIWTGKRGGLGVDRELAKLIALELKIEKYFLKPVRHYFTSPEGVGGRVESDNWSDLFELQKSRYARQNR